MEAKNMAGPENLRRGILPITSPQKERTASPVLPRPEVGTVPEAPLQPKKGKGEKKISTKARIALAGLAVAGAVETTGAVVNEQINEQPISTHTIPADLAWPWNLGKSAAEDIQAMFNKETPVPPTFDNNADVQFLKARINAIPVSPEKLPSLFKDSIKPLLKDSFPEASILLPVKLGEEQTIRVSISWTDQAFNDITKKPDRLAWGRKLLIPKKGTEIIIPVKEAEVFRQPLYNDNFAGVVLRFKDPDGVMYELYISTPEDVRHLVPMDDIKDAPIATGKYGVPEKTQQGLILPAGMSILKTDSNNANVAIGFGTAATPEHPKGLANKFDFLQAKDPQGNTTVFYLE